MEEIQSNEQTPSAPKPAGGSDATPETQVSSDGQSSDESPVVEAIEDLASSAMNIVTDVIVSVTDALGLIPDIETGNIPRGIQDGKKVIQDIEADAQDIEEIINKFKAIQRATSEELQTPEFKNLTHSVGQFFTDVENFVVTVKDEFTNKDFQDIPKTFAEGVEKAGAELQNSFNSAQEVIKDFGEKLKHEAQKSHDAPPAPPATGSNQIPDNVKNAAAGLMNKATHATTDIAQGASEAIGESMNKIGSVLGK